MDCPQVRKILFEYADEAFPEDLRNEVEAHLAVCGHCALQREKLLAQSDALRSMPRMEAPPDFLDNVRRRVEGPSPSLLKRTGFEPSRFFFGKAFLRFAATATAALLVVFAAQVALKEAPKQETALTVPSPALTPAPPAQDPPVETMTADRMMKKGFSGNAALPPPASTQAPPQSEHVLSTPVFPKPAAPQHIFSVELTLTPHPGQSSDSAPANRSRPEAAEKPVAPAPGAQPGKIISRSTAPPARAARESAPADRLSTPPDQLHDTLIVVKRLVLLANGRILSEASGPEPMLVAEMPSQSYAAFSDRLKQLGKLEPGATDPQSIPPDARVRVTINFEAPR